MTNQRAGSSAPGWGPRPAEAIRDDAGLSPARRRVLTALRELGRPVGLAELAAATSLHPNTVREHLQALKVAGSLRRSQAVPSGRGRPAWLYEPAGTVPGVPGLGVAEYVGLVSSLAAAIAENDTQPRTAAITAGLTWGRELAGRVAAPTEPGADAARRQVVALLENLGFAPETDPDTDPHPTVVRLTRCPLLDAARAYPEVVCGVHLGIARAALQVWGAPTAGTDLVAFSDPGFCRLQLAAATELGPKQ